MSIYPTKPLRSAAVADLAWLEGRWLGTIGGDTVEEHWSGPAGNTLMAMFRWLRDEQVRFFELMTIEAGENGIYLRIKHFNPALKGWEERDESVVLAAVRLTSGEAVFLSQGLETPFWLIYELREPDILVASFAREGRAQDPTDEFVYSRMP